MVTDNLREWIEWQASRLKGMRSVESDVCYFEVNVVFNGLQAEQQDKTMRTGLKGISPDKTQRGSVLSVV